MPIARSLPPPWSSPARGMCWSSPGSTDLARSMRQLLTTVDTLAARGIGLRSLHENIDTTSATGRLILHIFAALGQFEVELLRERTRTALAASRARGRVGGRPPALDAIKVTAAKAMLASGTMTASEVARQVGCSASTLYRHVPGGRAAISRERDVSRRVICRKSVFRQWAHGIKEATTGLNQSVTNFREPAGVGHAMLMVGVSGSESGSLRGRPRGQGYVRQHQKIQRETRFSGAPC